jgi:hypothetical protein
MNRIQNVGTTRGTAGVITLAPISAGTLKSISTPDFVQGSIGTLEYKDGAPSQAIVDKVLGHLDLMHGVEAFLNAYPGVDVSLQEEWDERTPSSPTEWITGGYSNLSYPLSPSTRRALLSTHTSGLARVRRL